MVVKDGAAFLFLDRTLPIVADVRRETLELVVESGFAASTLVGLTCDLRADVGPVSYYTSPSPRDQRGSRMPSSA